MGGVYMGVLVVGVVGVFCIWGGCMNSGWLLDWV